MSGFWDKMKDAYHEFDGVMQNLDDTVNKIGGLENVWNDYFSVMDDYEKKKSECIRKTVIRCIAMIAVTVLICIFV